MGRKDTKVVKSISRMYEQMNLDSSEILHKNTTALDMVTEGRKSHAVISFNENEEGEPPLHNGTVVWFKDIASLFANQLQNAGDYAIINEQSNEVDEKKSSITTILHRLLSRLRADIGCSCYQI